MGMGVALELRLLRVAAAAGVALVLFELRTDEPLLHLRLLRKRVLPGANVGTFANTLFLMGLIFFFNLYAQAVTLDFSAVTASLALLPFGFSMFVASLAVGKGGPPLRLPLAGRRRHGPARDRRAAAQPRRRGHGLRRDRA